MPRDLCYEAGFRLSGVTLGLTSYPAVAQVMFVNSDRLKQV